MASVALFLNLLGTKKPRRRAGLFALGLVGNTGLEPVTSTMSR